MDFPDYDAIPASDSSDVVDVPTADVRDVAVGSKTMELGIAQLQLIALGRVQGKSSYSVGRMLGLSPATVERVWDRNLRPGELERYDSYFREFSHAESKSALRHRSEMERLSSRAYETLERSLDQEDDRKLAADTAWRVLEEGGIAIRTSQYTPLGEGGGGGIQFNQQVNVMSPAAAEQLSQAAGSVLSEVQQMGKVRHVLEGNRHTRVNEKVVEVREHPSEEEVTDVEVELE